MDDMNCLLNALPRQNPDPDGDIQLDITDGAASNSIRMSSHMLRIASPVFKRMLTSEFKEGQVPQYGPRIITLKEDSPDAMTLICHAMYLTDLSEINVTIEILVQVVLLVDKYDCMSTVAAWGRLWLEQRVREEWKARSPHGRHTPNRYWTLLRVAYFFGDQSAFYDLTYNIIYEITLNELEDNSSCLSGTLVGEMPSFVRETIDAMRLDALNGFYDHLDSYLAAVVDDKNSKCLDQRPDACRLDATSVYFLRLLRRAEIWPRSQYVHAGTTVSSIRERLLEKARHGNFFAGDGTCRKRIERPLLYREDSKCECAPTDLASAVEINVGWGHNKGLCLGCIKETLARGKPLKFFEHGNCMEAMLRESPGPPFDKSHRIRMIEHKQREKQEEERLRDQNEWEE